MFDGVFHQGLQQQRRQVGVERRRVQVPVHLQPFAEAYLLDVEVALRQLNLF